MLMGIQPLLKRSCFQTNMIKIHVHVRVCAWPSLIKTNALSLGFFGRGLGYTYLVLNDVTINISWLWA